MLRPGRVIVGGLLAALAGAGCAPTLPLWSGATGTPKGRTDVAVGTAARVPLGNLAKARTASVRREAAAGGLAPGGQVRHGLGGGVDLGLTAVGTVARLDVRTVVTLDHAGTTFVNFMAMPGLVAGGFEDGSGSRGTLFGADLPLLFAVSYGSVVEAYGGPRLGLDRVQANPLGSTSTEGLGVRAGVTLGVATGFRGLHGMVELTAQHEWWSGEVGGVSTDGRGFALVPAVGLRLRM